MDQILVLVLVGFAAQFLGGALGMGYGVTCTSMLLLAGLTPAAASTSVHATEVVTGIVAGLSHWKLRNVDVALVARLAVPGCVAALIGGHLLAQLSTKAAKPAMAALLIGLGVFVLVRFVRSDPTAPELPGTPPGPRLTVPLGLTAGFIDATGGGGWGAITTSTMLGTGRVAPRIAVGSADAAKCLVSVAAVVGLASGGAGTAQGSIVIPLIGGGVVAAPIAAYVVTRLKARSLGVLAGLAIIGVNLPLVVQGAPAAVEWAVALVSLIAAALVLLATLRRQTGLSLAARVSDR